MISSVSENFPGKFQVIYADPPWRFQNYSQKGEGRNAVAHYDCLTQDQLRQLPVSDFAADNCVLLMWAIDPMLPNAINLIESWGFTYKTVGFYWAKLNKTADPASFSAENFFTGLGYWTRANVEQCLLATRGKPSRRARNVQRLIVSQRREHSRKPAQIYDRIKRLVDGPYLELFSRGSRPGWHQLGDQTGIFDGGVAITRRTPSNLARQRELF